MVSVAAGPDRRPARPSPRHGRRSRSAPRPCRCRGATLRRSPRRDASGWAASRRRATVERVAAVRRTQALPQGPLGRATALPAAGASSIGSVENEPTKRRARWATDAGWITAPAGPRMGAAVHVEQPLLRHLRVALGGADRHVAEQLLDDAQVGAVIEQVGGARVAQHVWRQLHRSRPTRAPRCLHRRPCRLPAEAAAAVVEEQRPRRHRAAPSGPARARSRPRRRQPGAEGRRRRAPVGHDALLRPLAVQPHERRRRGRRRRATRRTVRRSAPRSRTAVRAGTGRAARADRRRPPTSSSAIDLDLRQRLGHPLRHAHAVHRRPSDRRPRDPRSSRKRCSIRTVGELTGDGRRRRPRRSRAATKSCTSAVVDVGDRRGVGACSHAA